MIPYSDWLNDVHPDVPGCPRVVAIDAIRQTVIRFCQESMLWRYNMEPLITQIGVREYELDYPLETRVVSVRAMSWNGKKLDEKSADALDAEDPTWRTRKGQPNAYVFDDPNTIRLSHEPQSEYELAATLILKPTQASQTCGDILFEEYRKEIAAGAISMLMLMPKKPWTDYELATQKEAVFLTATSKAKVRASSAFGRRVRRRGTGSFF